MRPAGTDGCCDFIHWPVGVFQSGWVPGWAGAAAAFGTYTVFVARVGKAGSGLDGLALSVTTAAIVTLPFSIQQVGRLNLPDTGVLVVSALVGVVIPYAVDTIAGRITSARVVGTLFAIDPAMGALAGLVFLHQAIAFQAVVGIFLVVLAGGLVV